MADFLVSLSIFLLLLVAAYLAWFKEVDLLGGQLLEFRAGQACERALISITKSPGFPSNWASAGILPTSQALLGIGAADSYGRLDGTKLALMASYYNNTAYHYATRTKMGISPFEGEMWVSRPDGTNITAMGNAPAGSDVVLASRQRIASYQNKTVLVRVRVWQTG